MPIFTNLKIVGVHLFKLLVRFNGKPSAMKNWNYFSSYGLTWLLSKLLQRGNLLTPSQDHHEKSYRPEIMFMMIKLKTRWVKLLNPGEPVSAGVYFIPISCQLRSWQQDVTIIDLNLVLKNAENQQILWQLLQSGLQCAEEYLIYCISRWTNALKVNMQFLLLMGGNTNTRNDVIPWFGAAQPCSWRFTIL